MSQICNIEREPSRVHLLDFPNGKVTLLGIGKKYMNIFDCFKIRYPQFETILYISICSLKVAIGNWVSYIFRHTHTWPWLKIGIAILTCKTSIPWFSPNLGPMGPLWGAQFLGNQSDVVLFPPNMACMAYAV